MEDYFAFHLLNRLNNGCEIVIKIRQVNVIIGTTVHSWTTLSTTYWNPCQYFNVEISVWTNLCLLSFQHLSVLKCLLPNNDNNWGFTWWEWVILSIYLYDTLSHYYFCILFINFAKSILWEWNYFIFCIRKWNKYGTFFKQSKQNTYKR